MSLPSIVIVDDDSGIRESMAEYLCANGYAVETAESAEQGLDILKSKKIDVVITDIRMDGMDGLAMTRQIKAHGDINVIVITAYPEDYPYEEVIDKGADDIIFKPFKFDELLLRIKRVVREREMTRERYQRLKELKLLAITDDLTGLYNRRHFHHQLTIEISRFKRYKRPLSLMLIDIDHFKRYNDCHGHLEGDNVLRKTSDILLTCMRTTDSAYRYGGEEFTLILSETDCSSAMHVANRIRETIETYFSSVLDREKITVSIGVTEYDLLDSLYGFIDRADKAMYMAKKEGRNCIVQLRRGMDMLPLISV